MRSKRRFNYDAGPGRGVERDISISMRTTIEGNTSFTATDTVAVTTGKVAREYIILCLHKIRDKAIENIEEARQDTRTEPTPGGIQETLENEEFATVSHRGAIKISLDVEAPYAYGYDRKGHTYSIKGKGPKGKMTFEWARLGGEVKSYRRVRKTGTGFLSDAMVSLIIESDMMMSEAIRNVENGDLTEPPNGIFVPDRIRIYGAR